MLKQPSKSTLKKYGLELSDWQEMAESQDFVCFICQRLPKSNILCIDHQHIRGWKKQFPEQRKKAVRGLLCHFCNLRIASKAITLEKAKKLVEYLEQYEEKKQNILIYQEDDGDID